MIEQLRGLFKRTKQKVRPKISTHNSETKKCIDSLAKRLGDTEIIPTEYHGPSKEFVSFVASHELSYEIGELTAYGSLANLARTELEFIFRKHQTDLSQRYLAGRALGFTPKQILNYHKFPISVPWFYSDSTHSARKELTEKARNVSLTPEHLQKARLDLWFNSEYPGAPKYQGYKLILERTKEGYVEKELEIRA